MNYYNSRKLKLPELYVTTLRDFVERLMLQLFVGGVHDLKI